MDSNQVGAHALIGYFQLDLSKYIGKKNVEGNFELVKSKIPKAFVQFMVTVVKKEEVDDIQTFTKELDEQGNLEAQTVSMNAANLNKIAFIDEEPDQKEEEDKNQIQSAGDKPAVSELEQAKNIANGKIVLMKSNFLKLAMPLWSQYDEDNVKILDKEDFYMVAQDTVTGLSQKQSLKIYQNDLF